MLSFYIYISLLLIMIILMSRGLQLSKLSPIKIRIITIFIASTIIFRYISLLILSLSYSIKYLYFLKPFFFLNFIGVPTLALTVIYISIRVDNIKFSYMFILVAVLVCLYSIAMYMCPSIIQLTGKHGYTMLIDQGIYIYWIYIAINTAILFLSIILVMIKNLSNTGINLIIISSVVTIVEFILYIVGIRFVQENIIGDMLWVVTLVYTLNKVSKRTSGAG